MLAQIRDSKKDPPPYIQDDETLLSTKQVKGLVGGVSNMSLWRWMRDERVQFPKPMQMNRRNYWRLGDVRRWVASRVEQKAAA